MSFNDTVIVADLITTKMAFFNVNYLLGHVTLRKVLFSMMIGVYRLKRCAQGVRQ